MKQIGVAVLCGVILMVLTPSPALAQDDAPPVVFGIYYRCTQGQEARADEIFATSVAPVAQRFVDSGDLTGFLWLSHVQGGPWRRIFGLTGDDIPTMMDVRSAIESEVDAGALAELSSICSSHDDYIWTGLSNSPLNPDQLGSASLSAYHSCDMSQEARADEIFAELLAPLYQKHMDLNHLASWGFYAHRIGGIYRRLETMSGADHKTLLAMQEAIYTEAGETDAEALNELRRICSWHTDYMWEDSGQQ